MSDPQHKNGVPVWQRASTILTDVAHYSAPFITTFLLIHLSAPALANIGGSSLSSQVMLLGREYYQTPFGEKYLVLAPLIIHPVSALARRFSAPKAPRKATSLLSLTAYLAVPLLASHFLAHRYFPADPALPIAAVGPSELDYEYVKVALRDRPWRSWIGYAGLTLAVASHAVEGMRVIWNTRLRESLGRWTLDTYARAAVAVTAALPVLTGLLVISREPVIAFVGLVSRYQAALSK